MDRPTSTPSEILDYPNVKSYFEIVFKHVKARIEKLYNDPIAVKNLEQSIEDDFLGTSRRPVAEIIKNPKERFISDTLYRPFSEIMSSYEALRNIFIYIGSFPFKKQNVSQISYLRYHIEGYLNEAYILRERLLAYLKLIDKGYKSTKSYPVIHKATTSLISDVNKAFENLSKTRGSHVHKTRYSDRDLERLSLFETLSAGSDGELKQTVYELYRVTYNQARRKWRKSIASNFEKIGKLLNAYFFLLQTSVCENGKLIIPK